MPWSTPRNVLVFIGVVLVSCASPAAAGPAKPAVVAIAALPARVELVGPRDQQSLVVSARSADGSQHDLTREAAYTSSCPSVVRIDASGRARPGRDGEAIIIIRAAGLETTVPVRVRRTRAIEPVDFRREVLPVFTKAGCNQGACHGALRGKGGFRLSLLGFDPESDYDQILYGDLGRRVMLQAPEGSLLLRKPALNLPHGGGRRLAVGSPGHELVKQWLKDGAHRPSSEVSAGASLTVWPPSIRLVPGEQQQFLARVARGDGRSGDVTPLAQYDSLNDGVATVTPGGLITVTGPGLTYIMVRFCGQTAMARVLSPYAQLGPSTDFPRLTFVDDLVAAKWKEMGLAPSPLCTDAEFFRRIHLDAIATLPTPAAVKAFLADPRPDKRARAIDVVLDRPELADFRALRWGDLLRINSEVLDTKGAKAFHAWVRAALRDGKPLDEFVSDILTARGSTYRHGPPNFFHTGEGPLDWSESAARIFLGVRLECARCHHHPFEAWTQEDYYGMAAFFARVGTKRSNDYGVLGPETVIFLRSAGELPHPRKGAAVAPRAPGGPALDDPLDRRRALARWMTSPNNPFFARNLVNRVWGDCMGRGLYEPLDDQRTTNPASNPELLDALGSDFAAHRFDLKHLLRTILSSRTYQLSSERLAGNQADAGNVFFARHTLKRLTAEQLADALDFATGTHQKYPRAPLGTRAIELPDNLPPSFLLDVFGRPARRLGAECERDGQPNLGQALHLLNGDLINKKLAEPTGRVKRLVKDAMPPAAVVEELYLVTLSRPPTCEESAKGQKWLAVAPSPEEGIQDLLWALLNSREFLFIH